MHDKVEHAGLPTTSCSVGLNNSFYVVVGTVERESRSQQPVYHMYCHHVILFPQLLASLPEALSPPPI